MTLKNAAFVALIGTILLTILLAVSCGVSVVGFLRGVVSAASMLSAMIRVFATLSLAVFFYVFHKAQV
ncbi:MAG TPA: hypothetical protein VNH83_02310 [Bryobacteraceae bacterium]|jgi:hypothetical protein|nr:hypothetical protein [Bryobacteraceae bacterium]